MRHLVLLCALPFAVHAASLTYSAAGVFGPTVPVSIFTAPNQTWAFAFSVDVNPAVTDLVGGFDTVFTGFSYKLGGVPQAISPTVISFWDAANDGMLEMDFAADSRFSFTGPQMFTGTTAAPTMLGGVFVSTGTSEFDYVLVDGVNYGSLAGTSVYVTPEPGTWAMLTGGVLAFAAMRRRLADRG